MLMNIGGQGHISDVGGIRHQGYLIRRDWRQLSQDTTRWDYHRSFWQIHESNRDRTFGINEGSGHQNASHLFGYRFQNGTKSSPPGPMRDPAKSNKFMMSRDLRKKNHRNWSLTTLLSGDFAGQPPILQPQSPPRTDLHIQCIQYIAPWQQVISNWSNMDMPPEFHLIYLNTYISNTQPVQIKLFICHHQLLTRLK